LPSTRRRDRASRAPRPGRAGRAARAGRALPVTTRIATAMPINRLIAGSPEECGIDSAKLQAVFDRAELEVTEGRLEACQVAVARHGRLAGIATFGALPDGSPATDDTLFCCFSSTKATMAVAMWQLLEAGLWELSDPVCKFIPEFGTLGKERVLMRHLVTFTGGFPNPPSDLISPEKMGSSAARSAEFATWPLEWEPGSKWE
jgi:CubicO group peptidase (beta-lactamase class C family)